MSTKTKTTLACALALGLAAPALALAQTTPANTAHQTHQAQTHQAHRDHVDKPATVQDRATTQNTAERNRMAQDRTTRDRDTTDTNMERPDAWVLTKVKAKHAASSNVAMSDISVEVNDGVAHLRGTLATADERREAIRLTEETEGVKSVDATGLRVVPNTANNNR